MPEVIATGNNNPNFHPVELLFDPRRGMSWRQRVTCGKLTATAQAQLLVLLNQVQAMGASGKMVFTGEKPTLEYELPGVPAALSGVVSELFFDDWQMAIDDLTNTIFANLVLLTARGGLKYNDHAVLEQYLKLGSSTALDDIVEQFNKDVDKGSML